MKIYQIKLLTVIIALKNHFQTAQIIQKINHLITLTTEVDHQTKEIHVISHKTSIVDQIVEILNIEIIIRNQTQTDQIIRLIPIPIRTLGLDTIQLIDQKIHRTIDTEIIPTIETEAIRTIEISDIIINHEITQTKDLIITIIKIDHSIIHKTGIQTMTIDKETTLNRLIEIIQVIQILKINIEAIHQNIKDQ